MTISNKRFCVLPWIHVATDPDGSIKPCCIFKGHVCKPDGTRFNLGTDKLVDIINSPELVTTRSKMLNGEEIEGCSNCYQHEESGGTSIRQYSNKEFIQLSTLYKFREAVIPEKIEYFDLRFGNLCNLNCMSCQPVNSSQLSKEVTDISSTDTRINRYIHIDNLERINDWYNTDTFMLNIKSQINNIRKIYITGGEPTLIEKNYEMLSLLIEENRASSISLLINSNITNVKQRFLDTITKFKNVIIVMSVDGYGPTQEYLRYPSKWSQIDKNIRKLVGLGSNNIELRIAPVIQKVNLSSITDLFEYGEQINRDAKRGVIQIRPIILTSPEQLNLVYLPIEYKRKCWEKIQAWIDDNCKYQHNMFYEQIAALKEMCQLDVPYSDNMSKFIEFTDIFDKHRGRYLKDLNPELYNQR